MIKTKLFNRIGMVLFVAFFLIAAADTVSATASPVGSITVCKMIIDEQGNITDGAENPGTFVVPGIEGPFTSRGRLLAATTFTAPLNLNTNLIGDGANDAECVVYSDLDPSAYYYGQEIVTGANWLQPMYNDQLETDVTSTDSFYAYSDELFNSDPSDNDLRNRDSDGFMTLTASGPNNNRMLVILNQYTTPESVCGNGAVEQGEQCDDGNIENGDGCSAVCGFEELDCKDLEGKTGWYGRYYNYLSSHPNMEIDQGLWPDITHGDPLGVWTVDWYTNPYLRFLRIDPALNFGEGFFPFDMAPEEISNSHEYHFGIHWSAKVIAPIPNDYSYTIVSDDDSWLYLDGTLVGGIPGIHYPQTATGTLSLIGEHIIDIFFAERHITNSHFNFSILGAQVEPYREDCQGPKSVCGDGIDNDSDGLIDTDDPACHTDKDPTNPVSYDPAIDNENQPPTITLIGSNSILVNQGDVYSDGGATSNDSEDGDLTSQIVTINPVSTSIVDTYTITYTVTDSGGLSASATRAVKIKPFAEGCAGCGRFIIIDTPKIIISNEIVDYLGNGSALVNWQTNVSSTSRVVYSGASLAALAGPANYGYSTSTDETADLLKEHSILITGLIDGIKYFFRPISDNVESEEAIGKEVTYSLEQPPATTTSTTTIPVIATTTCNYLLDFLRIDFDNNPEETRKLQIFLKDFEGFDNLEASGVFDQSTFEAVRAFQQKYQSDILLPWGATEPTGYVYLTTKKKINEIYCQKEFPLTQIEQVEIENYRAALEAALLKGLLEIGMGSQDDQPMATTTTGVIIGKADQGQVQEIEPTEKMLVSINEKDLDVNPEVNDKKEINGLIASIVSGLANKDTAYFISLIFAILVIVFSAFFLAVRKKKKQRAEPVAPISRSSSDIS